LIDGVAGGGRGGRQAGRAGGGGGGAMGDAAKLGQAWVGWKGWLAGGFQAMNIDKADTRRDLSRTLFDRQEEEHGGGRMGKPGATLIASDG